MESTYITVLKTVVRKGIGGLNPLAPTNYAPVAQVDRATVFVGIVQVEQDLVQTPVQV